MKVVPTFYPYSGDGSAAFDKVFLLALSVCSAKGTRLPSLGGQDQLPPTGVWEKKKVSPSPFLVETGVAISR